MKMKIVSSQQMAEIESKACRDGSSEIRFMDEAGSGISLVVYDFIEQNTIDRQVILLCGKGNNAGDAYVAGLNLLHLGYEVIAYQLFPIAECSELCRYNHQRFVKDSGQVIEVTSAEDVQFNDSGVIVDGIFGTGFYGTVNEPIASIIYQANQSHLPIIAIDIPSGLNGETGEAKGEVIKAAMTAYLGLPKTGFFFREGWNYVGDLVHVDFGLPEKYVEEVESDLILLSRTSMTALKPQIKRTRNKYEAGYVVGMASSPGYPGAGILASESALCAGAGIVRLLYPDGMQAELAHSPYELIKAPYHYNDAQPVLEVMNRATAAFIGPGFGLQSGPRLLLHAVLPNLTIPCVIDADALTILSEENMPLPAHSILTPHLGEMCRLLHVTKPTELTMEFLKTCQIYVNVKNVTLILKGAPTFIFHPNQPIVVSPFGDPGMATAGSGDVLTGLIASLLAQGLIPRNAAILGVYLHALAGENAAQALTSYCMVATDMITFFPDAFRAL